MSRVVAESGDDAIKLVVSMLAKMDKRLGNIETHLQQPTSNIKEVDEQKDPQKNLKGKVSENSCEEDASYARDNFMNQMRAEVESLNIGETSGTGRSEKSRSKVSKSASFRDKSPTKYKASSKRFPHTVPSDKDESKRISSFRRECLSKAIQWHMVDLTKALKDDHKLVLPKWVTNHQSRQILECATKEKQLAMFFCILKNENFETMEEWLTSSKLDKDILNSVFETYDEFSDSRTNQSEMKCFKCRLSENVHFDSVINYMFSGDIISEETLKKALKSKLPVGAQTDLWERINEECREHASPRIAASALKVAFLDAQKEAYGVEKQTLERLLKDIDTYRDTPEQLFHCFCSELCSKSLHPISCVRSMSLAGLYFSPPTSRKTAATTSADTGWRSSSDKSAPSSPVSLSSSGKSAQSSPVSKSSSDKSSPSSPALSFSSANLSRESNGEEAISKEETATKSVYISSQDKILKTTYSGSAAINKPNTCDPPVPQRKGNRSSCRVSRKHQVETARASYSSGNSSDEKVGRRNVSFHHERHYQNNRTIENKPNVFNTKTVNIYTNSTVYSLPNSRSRHSDDQTSSSDS